MDAMELIDRRAEVIMETAERFREFVDTTTPDEVSPAAGIELARAIGRAMSLLSKGDMAEEHFSELLEATAGPMGKGDTAEVVGYFVMQALCDRITMNLAGKTFLMEVADILGSVRLEELRRNAAFMVKVESF